MSRPDPQTSARRLVADQFPAAHAAWLGGSVVRGEATATSDLDITVLLGGPPAPYRESINYGGWPVELFVHTRESLAHYRAKDLQRRQPSIFRLVGESVVLVDNHGVGDHLRRESLDLLAAGPPALTSDEKLSQRYGVTDLIMDLEGTHDPIESMIIAAELLRSAGTLLLTGAGLWTGTGKGLLRELRAYDRTHRTSWAMELPQGVIAAEAGDPSEMIMACDRILEPHGGRLFAGFRLAGDVARRAPSTPASQP